MNILLLNLARFGDLLQSQAAISGLVRQGHRVGLVCLDNFAEAASLLSGLSHLAPVPGAAFFPEKPGEARGWPGALAALAAWRESLHAVFAPELVCNLIPSLASQLLAPFVARGAPCTGFFVDEHGFGVSGSPWASFLQGSSLSRGVSPFNMVDLFSKIAGADSGGTLHCEDSALQPPMPEECAAASAALQAERPQGEDDCRGFVAFQLGASEERRRWPVSFFARLGDTLWREGGYLPVLLGSKGETALAERYGLAAKHPFISMCGRTGLRDLAAVLCSVRLLVSNDTGTMHLASGLGLPVLAVFLATAQPFDTGPYTQGSCSVEPDLPCHPCSFGKACEFDERCRKRISPDLLAGLALSRLEEGKWRMPGPEGQAPEARVWLSAADGQGYMDLQSLSGHEKSGRAGWLALQRHYLRQFLDRDASDASFTPLDMERQADLPEAMRAEIARGLEQAEAFIAVLRQQGLVLRQKPVALIQNRFLDSWEKVREALGGSPLLKALAVLWTQGMQAPGQNLETVLALAEDFSRLLTHIRKALRHSAL